MHIGIVGSAFKTKDLRKKLTPDKWKAIVSDVKSEIFAENAKYVIAVSGGCSGIDHAAVCAFLDGAVDELVLCLPCAFENGRFYDNRRGLGVMNPGGTLNSLHEQFSNVIGRDTLKDLSNVIHRPNVRVEYGKGFHARNSKIAIMSNRLIAYTFSYGQKPDDGGTLDTWTKFRQSGKHPPKHVPIGPLIGEPEEKKVHVIPCDFTS